VLDEMALEQHYLPVFLFFTFSIIPPSLYMHNSSIRHRHYTTFATESVVNKTFLQSNNIIVAYSDGSSKKFRLEPIALIGHSRQVTGMALAHCILGKFLWVVCH